MKQNYSFAKRVSAIAATSSIVSYIKHSLRLIPCRLCTLFLLAILCIGNIWGAASTISDNAYLNGTVSFEDVGALSATTTYWFNGIKFYSAGSDKLDKGGDRFTTAVNYPGYVSSVEAGNKWGNYQISGLVLQQHRFSVRVKGEGNLVLVVDCNQSDQNPIPNLKALIDNIAYADKYSNTKATGTSASFESVCESGKGHYTLTMKITKAMLSNDEVVICFFYNSSGSGAGKVFVYESVTFTPSVSSYTVTYDYNDGGVTSSTQEEYTGEALTLPTPDRGGYDFLGWSDGTKIYGAGASYTPAGNVTLTAQWAIKTYTVSFDMQGHGTAPAQQTIEHGSKATEPTAPTAEGFIFGGWYTDESCADEYAFSFTTPITTPITLYAKWTEVVASGYCIRVYNSDADGKHNFIRGEGTHEYIIPNFTIPSFTATPNYWVGENDKWSDGFSKDANFEDMPLTTKAALKLGKAGGATGTLHIWDDNKEKGSNLWIKFTPDGYGLCWGADKWNEKDYLPFTSADGVTYTTAMVALTAEQLDGWSYYVGYKTANSYVYSSTNSETKDLKTIGVYANNAWWSGNIGGFFTAGQRGVFRMWADNADAKNWQCHFVPYYGLCYNANYPAGVSETAPVDTWSDFVSVEEKRTLTLAAAPVAPAGYIFKGWTTAQDGTGVLLNPGGDYALNNPAANTTLYAQWTKVYNVVYDLDDATGVVPTETSKTEGATFALALADGITKEGFNFAGWFDGEKTYQAGEAYTMPAHDVIFTALWEGPCFVMTKNAKTDKIAAEESDITAWFDIRGGTGAKVMFHPSGERTPTNTALPFGNDKDMMVVTLPDGSLFTAGTVLKVILESGSNDRGLSIDGVEVTGLRVNKLITLEYTLPDNYQDSKSIELKRAGGTISIRSLEVNGCGVECLDPVPALSVDNAVLCSAGNVTFTVTNYAPNARLELYRAGAKEADPATLLKTIESATGESVTFEPIAVDATSSYYVVATAGCERPSEPVTVTLAKQPTAVTISGVPPEAAIGETYTFKATLVDGEGTNFQWYRNGNPIDGATAATYEFTPQKEDELQNIEFSCKFIGCGGAEVSSAPATTKVVLNSCYYITEAKTLSATTGYDFGDFVLYTDGNKDKNYKTSTSDICASAAYRYYTTGVTVYLKNYGAAALRLQGRHEAKRTVAGVEIADALDGVYIPLTTGYTAVDYTSTSKECGELGIENVQIPKGKYVHITFANQEEFRISGLCVEGWKCRMPALAWSLSELTCGINETPELPTLTNDDNLPVVYSSSDKTVATVNAAGAVTVIGQGTTAISAVFDGDDTYCATTASYVLTVTCGDDVPQIAPEEGSVSCMAVELRLLQSDGTTLVSSGKVQWYRDGVAIEGATGYTYTATTAGEYTATLEQTCTVTTSNKAVIASTVTSPDIKAFSPFRTYQITRREVDGVPVRPYSADTHYPLFTLKPTVPDDGTKLCRFTLVVRNGSNVRYTISTPTDNDELDWIRRDFIRDGTIHIGANYPKLGEWIRNYNKSHTDNPFVVGDTIWLTAHPLNACGEYDMDVTATIPIKLTDKFSIAYIITGPDGGSFYEVTEGNLDAFYQQFRASDYEITPVNAYAPYDYYYYEPYDLVILTDYPKATGDNSYPNRINELADLVDRKPMLSFKAHMAENTLPKWKELGFAASPQVPDAVQTKIQLLCSDHPIFEGEEIGQVEILSQGDGKKGLQGFSELGMDGFVNIATVDGGNKGTLVACCERQNVVEARLVVLSIYSGATQYITTTKGMQAVDNVLEYLLQTDETKLSDCSIIFTDATGDKQWTTAANWQGGKVPNRLQNVRIEADCEVSGGELQIISNVNINNKYRLTIKPDGALGSLGKFSVYSDENKTYSYITDPGYVTIEADETATGALLHTHHIRPLVATVQLYSKAHIEMVDGKKNNYWAYVGIPVQEAPVPQFFNGAYTWQYDEKDPKAWIRYGNGTTMTAFKGYGLSQPAPQLFTLTGQLAYAQDRVVTLTRTESAGKGQNLIGNSWTAPIQITLLEATDFGEGLQQTIYIYNTGRDAVYGEGGYGGVNDKTPGQWRTIPIATAKLEGYDGPKTIPAMQAFEVDFVKDATQKNANLTLKYNRVVRTSKGTDLNMPLYAPRRKAQAVTDEPELMRICVEDSRTRTELYLLQDGRFTDDFDNGWDGFYMEGNGPAAGLWAFTPVGDMAVSAQPAIDGTTLGFRPGRENLYTFSFQWEGEVLYLNDMLLRQSVQIRTGNTYAFTAFDNEAENRFVISHEPCSEVNTSLADIVLTGDLLTLNNPAGELLDVLVYDPAGRICTTRQTADNLVKLDLPATQGVYMVCVRTTDGNKVYKVVR